MSTKIENLCDLAEHPLMPYRRAHLVSASNPSLNIHFGFLAIRAKMI